MVNENNEEKKIMLRHMKTKKEEDYGVRQLAMESQSEAGRQVC
jgi:hypothetical protein